MYSLDSVSGLDRNDLVQVSIMFKLSGMLMHRSMISYKVKSQKLELCVCGLVFAFERGPITKRTISKKMVSHKLSHTLSFI